MTSSIDPALLARIRSSRALPSPPVVTARLIEIGENPHAGMDEILEVLRTDAALSARLLRLANSPLYARRRRTENLRQAVTLLGVDAVLTAALSLTLLNEAGAPAGMPPRFRRDRWTRSVHAAVAAQTLAEQTKCAVPADAFLASLLQDIGIQVVLRLEPDTYRTLPAGSHHDELVGSERAILGADHAAIGGELLEAWRLPERIVDAVRVSHDHDLSANADALGRVTVVGGLIADGMQGDSNAVTTAAEAAERMFDMSAGDFAGVFEDTLAALPDLASILEAEAPDPMVIAEMAQDVLVARLMSTQTAANELSERLTAMTNHAESLQAENQLDPLTGLSNRRHLDEVLHNEFALATEHGFPLSVLFVDLDDFKKVNDRYGHGVGDELLVQSSRRISACVRDGDVVGRYGGEEFVVVLPGAGVGSSDSAADRLVERFNHRQFNLGSELSLAQTISIGVATQDDVSSYESVSEMVHAADLALYAAKRSGKNRWRRSAVADVSRAVEADGDAAPDVRDRTRPTRTTDNVG